MSREYLERCADFWTALNSRPAALWGGRKGSIQIGSPEDRRRETLRRLAYELRTRVLAGALHPGGAIHRGSDCVQYATAEARDRELVMESYSRGAIITDRHLAAIERTREAGTLDALRTLALLYDQPATGNHYMHHGPEAIR